MLKGRRLAFDFGTVRIGVAVSDLEAIIASPVATLNAQSPEMWILIAGMIEEYSPVTIYIGNPLHLSGQSSASSTNSEIFAREMEERFNIPTTLIDERLSTVMAGAQLKASGKNSMQARKEIDQIAAVGILEQGLAIERQAEGWT